MSTLDAVPPGLIGLLRQVPESWTMARRDEFIRTFLLVLDFSVPIDEPAIASDPKSCRCLRPAGHLGCYPECSPAESRP